MGDSTQEALFSLGFVLLAVIGAIGFAFAQWQGYQDDDEDFFTKMRGIAHFRSHVFVTGARGEETDLFTAACW